MNNRTDVGGTVLKGNAAVPGIAVGKAHIYRRLQPNVSETPLNGDEVFAHLEAFREGISVAEKELTTLLETQNKKSVKELLNVQIEMLKDPDLHEQVETEIKSHNRSASAAVSKVFEMYFELMKERGEEPTTERSVDITDTRDRLIQILHNQREIQIDSGTVLVTQVLSPREVIDFSEQKVGGIIMENRAHSSHAVILARALQIPMIIGVEQACKAISSEQPVVLDARDGKVMVNPAPQNLREFQEASKAEHKEVPRKKSIRKELNRTADGHPFCLRANMGFAEELDAVLDCRAEGIGLLRTELEYLNSDRLGSEEKQQSFYQLILEKTKPHPVNIRLFDAGGDKLFDSGQQEENPYLGWRGIRMLLDEKNMLKQQLRAILSVAGQYTGRVGILVPMISTVDEVESVKKIITNVQQELKNDGQPIDPDVRLGIMVEVPAVALQAEEYAGLVDFLSIGTNDLTQYLLAVDRGNDHISKLYNQQHPVLWKMIKRVAEVGRAADTPVSVCGELASDPTASCVLLGLDISELSMTPSTLLGVKQMLRDNTSKSMQQLAEKVLNSTTVAQVDQILNNFKQDQA